MKKQISNVSIITQELSSTRKWSRVSRKLRVKRSWKVAAMCRRKRHRREPMGKQALLVTNKTQREITARRGWVSRLRRVTETKEFFMRRTSLGIRIKIETRRHKRPRPHVVQPLCSTCSCPTPRVGQKFEKKRKQNYKATNKQTKINKYYNKVIWIVFIDVLSIRIQFQPWCAVSFRFRLWIKQA